MAFATRQFIEMLCDGFATNCLTSHKEEPPKRLTMDGRNLYSYTYSFSFVLFVLVFFYFIFFCNFSLNFFFKLQDAAISLRVFFFAFSPGFFAKFSYFFAGFPLFFFQFFFRVFLAIQFLTCSVRCLSLHDSETFFSTFNCPAADISSKQFP